MALSVTVKDNDWTTLRQILQKLSSSKLGSGASVTHSELTLSSLTASRLIASDASKGLVSSDLASWITGTAKRVTVTDDGDGTVTLSGPQNIDTVDSPTFAGLTLTAFTGILQATAGVLSGGAAHSALTSLTVGDDHTQYALLAGRSGGQTLYGSTVTAEDLTLGDNSVDDNTITVTQIIAAYTHSQVAGGDSVHVSVAENAAWDAAYAHSLLVAGNPHVVTPTELGLVIGTNVQAWDAQLDDIAALAYTNGNIIVGDGSNWVAESGATARTSLGLGTGDSPQFAQLKIDDTSTYIDKDGSDNMTFTDAVTGTKTLAQLGSPTYLYIKATAQAEGDLHLSDITHWAVSKVLIKYIRVVTSSTNWDLYVLQNDNSFATDDANIPKIKIADGINGNANIWLELPYEDEDDSDEVHLYYLDNSGANTADIYIIGYSLN